MSKSFHDRSLPELKIMYWLGVYVVTMAFLLLAVYFFPPPTNPAPTWLPVSFKAFAIGSIVYFSLCIIMGLALLPRR